MSIYQPELMTKIEELREEMTAVAHEKGMTSEESLVISQELDALLNDYEYYKHKNYTTKAKNKERD